MVVMVQASPTVPGAGRSLDKCALLLVPGRMGFSLRPDIFIFAGRPQPGSFTSELNGGDAAPGRLPGAGPLRPGGCRRAEQPCPPDCSSLCPHH